MLSEVAARQNELQLVCEKYDVRTLDLFGSAATGEGFDEGCSDLDFLVDFAPSERMGPADQYFGLLEELQALFQRDVDLVTARSLRNRFFIASVNATRRRLYAR